MMEPTYTKSARKSSKRKKTTARVKGTQKLGIVQRKDKEGNWTSTEYRQPYKIWIDKDGALLIVRRFGCSMVSPKDAIAKAAKAVAENEVWWQKENAGRGLSPLTMNEGILDEVAAVPAIIIPERKKEEVEADDLDSSLDDPTLAEVAYEMISEPRKYRFGKLVGIKASVRRKYQGYITAMLNPETGGIGNRKISTLQLSKIKKWFLNYCETHSESTAYRLKAWLVRLGKHAVDNKYWSENLFTKLMDLSKTPQAEKRVLTFEEIDKIWNAAEPRLKAILVLVRLGFRIGEALAVTADDLIGENVVEIKYTLTETNLNDDWANGEGSYVPFLGDPKTSGSAAKVRVPKAWMKILKDALETASAINVRAYDDPKNVQLSRKFVCHTRDGLVYDVDAATKYFKNLLKKLGFVYDTGETKSKRQSVWHMWRYTYCSDLVALDANDIELRYCMRHSDANLSKTVYAQIREESKALYAPYTAMILTPSDYNEAVASMDEDRRHKRGPWAK
ncbi:MAG: hypothetical protein EOP06_00575 [Proteobacteria bacterium]|nr:MAG: hypothetical protein EOP06_00575 [Pseudomonadota bacterium]